MRTLGAFALAAAIIAATVGTAQAAKSNTGSAAAKGAAASIATTAAPQTPAGTLSATTPARPQARQPSRGPVFARPVGTVKPAATPASYTPVPPLGSDADLPPGSGPVMNTVTISLVFWLPTGQHFETSAATDTNYESLMSRWVQDVGGTPYADILSQYYDPLTGRHIDPAIKLGGVWTDTRAYPHAGTQASPLTDSDITGEVTQANQTNVWPIDVYHLVVVFTASGIQECASAGDCTFGNGTFCAYHNATNSFGAVQQPYAYIPDTKCNAISPPSPNNDVIADTDLNSVSHEVFEAITDPLANDTWAADDTHEIGDQCNDTFAPQNNGGADVYLHGHPYLLQKEWSNHVHTCAMDDGTSGVFAPTVTTDGTMTPAAPAANGTFTYVATLTDTSDTAPATNLTFTGSISGATGLKITDSTGGSPTWTANGTSGFKVSYDTIAVHQVMLITITGKVTTGGSRTIPCPTVAFGDLLAVPRGSAPGCRSGTQVPVDGTPTAVVTSTVGQIGHAQFSTTGTAPVGYSSQAMNLSGCGTSTDIAYTLYGPSGNVMQTAHGTCASSKRDVGALFPPTTLPAGTYQISIVPGGLVYGTYTLQMFSGTTGTSIPLTATPTTATTTNPGQSSLMSFTAIAGQTIYSSYILGLTGCNGGYNSFTLYTTGGTRVATQYADGNCFTGHDHGAAFAPLNLAAGTYVLQIIPEVLTYGTYTFQLSTGTGTALPLTGAKTTVTASSPGQAMLASFTTTAANQPLYLADQLSLTPCTYNDWVEFTLWDPSGNPITGSQGQQFSSQNCKSLDPNLPTPAFATHLGAAGRYVLQIIPQATTQGSITIQAGPYVKFVNHASGKDMEVAGSATTDGANIDQRTDSVGAANEQWTVTSQGSTGYLTFANRNSGKNVEVAGSATTDGANVDQRTYVAGAANQEWTLVNAGGGYYSFVNANSKKYLEVAGSATTDGANVDQSAYVAAAANQQWSMVITS